MIAKHNGLTEEQHQALLFQWAGIPLVMKRYPGLDLLHHIPNGGKRDKVTAARLKAQGVKPGVPDLSLPVARGPYHGLYIEMKTAGGRVSDAQKAFGESVQGQGYCFRVCRGFQEARDTLIWYLEQKGVGE